MRSTEHTKKYLIAIALALITWSFALIAPTAHAQSVTSLACSPSIIGGGSGGSATCTVTLSAAAPSSGTRVALTSSLIELAASVPSVTVLGGQTTANFTVTTNANYRRYSLLAFNATISATNEATASATLSVTAQARPADFFSDSGNNLNFGKVCGGSYPAPRAEFGILFNCNQGPQGVCTFLQECTLGCKEALHVSGQADNDFCPTTPPLPFALDQKYVVGGNAATGTLSFANPSQAAPNEVGGLFERWQQNQELHLHDHRQRRGDGKCAVGKSASSDPTSVHRAQEDHR